MRSRTLVFPVGRVGLKGFPQKKCSILFRIVPFPIWELGSRDTDLERF